MVGDGPLYQGRQALWTQGCDSRDLRSRLGTVRYTILLEDPCLEEATHTHLETLLGGPFESFVGSHDSRVGADGNLLSDLTPRPRPLGGSKTCAAEEDSGPESNHYRRRPVGTDIPPPRPHPLLTSFDP